MSGLDMIMMNNYMADGDSDIAYLYSEALEENDNNINIPNNMSESEFELRTEDMFSSVYGGSIDNKDNKDNKDNYFSSKPKGGFPAIYVYKDKKKKNDDEGKQRELSTRKSNISIMDILKQKKLSRTTRGK